jgi:hypothetical protein
MRIQGLWYSGAFLFTFFPMAVDFLCENRSVENKESEITENDKYEVDFYPEQCDE